MKKITRLKICNISLAILIAIMLASGIMLEVRAAGQAIWVWLHIALGAAFFGLIFWHLSLNRHIFSSRRRGSDKKGGILWLGIIFILILLSAVVATCHWIDAQHHTHIGALHGKIGFLFIVATALHTILHRKFYATIRRKRKP